jgi:hypothetical protein
MTQEGYLGSPPCKLVTLLLFAGCGVLVEPWSPQTLHVRINILRSMLAVSPVGRSLNLGHFVTTRTLVLLG